MPLTDLARFGDEDLPRCPVISETGDDNVNPSRQRGRWECSLPDGHEDYNNERHQPHSWVKVD